MNFHINVWIKNGLKCRRFGGASLIPPFVYRSALLKDSGERAKAENSAIARSFSAPVQ
jgi:hypothetical protein